MGFLPLTPYVKLETPRLRRLLRHKGEGLLGHTRRPKVARSDTCVDLGMGAGQETHESSLPFCSALQLAYLCGFGTRP